MAENNEIPESHLKMLQEIVEKGTHEPPEFIPQHDQSWDEDYDANSSW